MVLDVNENPYFQRVSEHDILEGGGDEGEIVISKLSSLVKDPEDGSVSFTFICTIFPASSGSSSNQLFSSYEVFKINEITEGNAERIRQLTQGGQHYVIGACVQDSKDNIVIHLIYCAAEARIILD